MKLYEPSTIKRIREAHGFKFSKSLGQTTLTFQNKSKNRDEKDSKTQGYSYSEQRQGRELMTVDELKRLPNDDEIILIRGLKPIYAKKAWYYLFHPERDAIKPYEIKDITQMPKPEEVEIKTMDVEGHINERLKRAREVVNKAKQEANDVEIDTSSLASDLSKEEKAQTTQANVKEAEVDLQKELERKFDELFGTSKKDAEE